MRRFILLVAITATCCAQKTKPHVTLSSEFILTAETVIDEVDNSHANTTEAEYRREMQPARTALSKLGRIATSPKERSVIDALSLMVLSFDTCQMEYGIISKDFAPCLELVHDQRGEAMKLMGRTKAAGVWYLAEPKK